eukprot:10584999-Alexandrium_andersonii.AAC.1
MEEMSFGAGALYQQQSSTGPVSVCRSSHTLSAEDEAPSETQRSATLSSARTATPPKPSSRPRRAIQV